MTKAIEIQGIPASYGVAMGEARVLFSWDAHIVERAIGEAEVAAEVARIDAAVEATLANLQVLRDSAGKSLGGPVAKIFDAQLMIAGDQEFLRRVKSEVAARLRNAEYVYSALVDEATEPLRRTNDTYMRQMLTDIEAVSKKVLGFLTNESSADANFPTNTIIVSKKLTPGEVLHFHECSVTGFVTVEGSPNSHMALIARSLSLPAVVGADKALNRIRNGTRIIVDGGLGKVFVEPDETLWEKYKKVRIASGGEAISKLAELSAFPPVTSDGHAVSLAANIELPGPRDRVLAERGAGVGLYRTEFIYLQSNHFPPEETQFETYDAIAAQYAPYPVVMRTFDLGSDKYVEELQPLVENNPALGWRGIRTSLDMPGIFRPQIRAILRASARRNVKILLPMITDAEEFSRARDFIDSVKRELQQEGRRFDENIEIGAMIEVPSAALTAPQMAACADFLSIGSNDLTQYTLAVDRDNTRVAGLYRMFHPAVVRLIDLTCQAARTKGKKVTVCGELAGDLRALPLLLGLGVETMSMNPTKIYQACLLVGVLSWREAQEFASRALEAQSADELERSVTDFHNEINARLIGARSEQA